ncbi:MAG: hypothetical protein AB8F78_09395 [Saprospiraceae bacterium]
MNYAFSLSKNLQTLILSATCCLLAFSAHAQLGVAFYQSDLQFIGINYEYKDRYRAELSIGVDQNIENVPFMLDVTYDILNKDHYEIYAGAGIILFNNETEGKLTIALGINIFPFENRQFGFHIEALPVFINEDSLLLGSWGIRYKFGKDE